MDFYEAECRYQAKANNAMGEILCCVSDFAVSFEECGKKIRSLDESINRNTNFLYSDETAERFSKDLRDLYVDFEERLHSLIREIQVEVKKFDNGCVSIGNLIAITPEEKEASNRIADDMDELEQLMDDFYTKGFNSGKTEEQLDVEWEKIVDDYFNNKYNSVTL